MKELSLKQKSTRDLVRRVTPVKRIIKDWFFHAGMKFLQGKRLTDEQEVFLEEVTDFFMENLDNIDVDRSYLDKIDLGPIQLPKKKDAEV